MHKVSFTGRVLPEALAMSIHAPEIKWKWPEKNLDLIFRTSIEFNAIKVECDLEQFDMSFVPELYKRATDLARAASNMVAFGTGIGVLALLDKFKDPDGNEIPTRRQEIIPIESRSSSRFDPGYERSFQDTFQLVLQEPALFMALDDLIRGVTSAHTQLADCGRVVDRLRRVMVPHLDGTAAWTEMQRQLNVSAPYQKWVTEMSKGSRHGDSQPESPETCGEAMHRTWAILNRFIEWRKRASKPLTAPDFPLLS